MSIEIKDSEIPEASIKTVELVKKYERFQTTVIGAEKASVNEWIGSLDDRICLWCDKWTGIKIMLGLFTGLLPFLKLDKEALFFPYITPIYRVMKRTESKESESFLTRIETELILLSAALFNMFASPAMQHLRERGIFTAYWVIND